MDNNISSNGAPRRSTGGRLFIICSSLLFLGAIGVFIWLLVDAAEEHLVKNILFGSAFLIITVGVLIYAFCISQSPRTAKAVLWTTIVLGIASYIVGLCIKTDEPDVDIDGNIVPATEVTTQPQQQ